LCSSSAWHVHSHTPAAPMSDEVLSAHDTAEEPADHTDQIQVQASYRNVGDLDATWLGKRIALFFSRQECFTELLAGLGQIEHTPIFSMSLRAQHLDASSSRLILPTPV
jgi:hypothetical protein